MILAVDASLPILSIALVRDDATVMGAIAMEGKGSRNEKLLPSVDFLLNENSISREELRMLVGTKGPGSFTGVRIGLATLQGLALALNLPLHAFTTHEALAEIDPHGSFTVIGDAGRSEVYATDFEEGISVRGPELRSRAGVIARYEAESLMHERNIALLAAHRAVRLRTAGVLEQFTDATPTYVRLAEAEVRLQQKSNG